MIDLFSVKLNNKYDFIQAEVPAGSGTWLCSATNGDYVKGYSYEVVEGVATRIEQSKDYLINNSIYSTIENVCSYLNNMFFVKNLANTFPMFWDCITLQDFPYDYNYIYTSGSLTFENGVISPVSYINTGDLIFVYGQRNRFFSYVTDVDAIEVTALGDTKRSYRAGSSITVNNPAMVNTTEPAAIFVAGLPQSVEKIIAQMISYDVFNREAPNDLQSEHIGNYSYTKADYLIGSMAYPSEIVSGLNAFKRVRFV